MQRGLQSDEHQERLEVYRRIATLQGEERAAAVRLVQAENRRWSSAYQRAARRVEDLAPGPVAGIRTREDLLDSWEQAARRAMGLIFDEELFPTPVDPVSGPYAGYEEVQAAVRPAAELYRKLRRQAGRDLKEALRLQGARATALRDELLQSHGRAAELSAVLDALGERVEPLRLPPPLALAALFVSSGDWQRACGYQGEVNGVEGGVLAACQVDWAPASAAPDQRAGERSGGSPVEPATTVLGAVPESLKGWDRFLFHHLLGERIEEHNAAIDLQVSPSVREAVSLLNDHRRALGVRPLQLHAQLTAAIRDHVRGIRRLTHDGKTPQTADARRRVQAAGYPAPLVLGENLATRDIVTAIEQWKWDGGHYRILVHPCAVHIGAFQAAYSGMIVAAGEAPQVPSLCLWRLDL